jgi:hypothetical protein
MGVVGEVGLVPLGKRVLVKTLRVIAKDATVDMFRAAQNTSVRRPGGDGGCGGKAEDNDNRARKTQEF